MQLLSFILSLVFYIFATISAGATFDATNPAATGYVPTFDDEFNSLSTIDINNTKVPGFKWYVQYPFGSAHALAGDFSVTSGVLTITPTTANMGITTVVKDGAGGVRGQVFGQGYYAEARIAFDNTQVITANGWPAFWGESVHHILTLDRWPGQPTGYAHFIEDDFFEYDTAAGSGANSYGGAWHDWYGIYNVTCSLFCNVTNNGVISLGSTTWTSFHTVGRLYIPGTPANGMQGSSTSYFDGVAVGTPLTWTGVRPGTAPPSGTFEFSVIDNDQMTIVVGSGAGLPLQVDYVRVWQIATPRAPINWLQ